MGVRRPILPDRGPSEVSLAPSRIARIARIEASTRQGPNSPRQGPDSTRQGPDSTRQGPVRRASVFLPRSTAFYRGLLPQILRGFVEVGISAHGDCQHLDGEALARWCEQYSPDLVFEMNRARCSVPSLDPTIRHVAWIVDLQGKGSECFQGSDLTCVFGPGWIERIKGSKWMGPGACPLDYHPATQPTFEVDTSFVGHVPLPWTHEELSRPLTLGRRKVTFGEVLPELEKRLREHPSEIRVTEDYLQIVQEIVQQGSDEMLALDDVLRYDLSSRVIRGLGRRDFLGAVVKSGCDLRLFGSKNWAEWEEFRPYYRGSLSSPSELRHVYQTSRLNLHEGVGIHFRSVDCMASGGVMVADGSTHDHRPGGTSSFFQANSDFLSSTPSTVGQVIEEALLDPDHLAGIRRNAALAIRSGHTWAHRIRWIVENLPPCQSPAPKEAAMG
jgi:hypothetical protein